MSLNKKNTGNGKVLYCNNSLICKFINKLDEEGPFRSNL